MIVLYIATSIDGYIARPDGSVDWLSRVENEQEDYGYADFYQSVDALVMGSNTYQQILDAGDWPYPDKPSYVMSDKTLPRADDDVRVISGSVYVVEDLFVEEKFERVWLVGGGELASAFQHAQLIDEYIISIVPVILGDGIPLFQSVTGDGTVRLTDTKTFSSGVVQLCYASE
ncbi:MAG: dihydrofolate reductase family protein [Gammaproteobacteria bacterium]|jgi:dihydrofolate reductase